MKKLVSSHNAENKPAQTARGSWPSGVCVQETTNTAGVADVVGVS